MNNPLHISVPGGDEVEVHQRGDPKAPAIVYAHGMPSSGKEADVVLGTAETHGFQVVAPTRPGYGHSTVDVRKSIGRINEDMLRILDRLGIHEAYAVETSAGAKHALGLAQREPQRIRGVSLLAGLPPINEEECRSNLPAGTRFGLKALSLLPGVRYLALRHETRRAQRNPRGAIESFIRAMPPSDQAVLLQPEIFEQFTTIVRDWSQQETGHGFLGDALRIIEPWQVNAPRLKDIPVQIIHGAKDPVVPLAAAKTFERMLPGTTIETLEEGGHAVYAYPDVSRSVIDRIKRILHR